MKFLIFLASILIFYETNKYSMLEYKKNKLGSFILLTLAVTAFLLPNFILYLYY